MDISLGELGMTYEQYCSATLFEIFASYEGYLRRWEEPWRHTRTIISTLVNIHSSKKVKATDLFELPSDLEDDQLIKLADGEEIMLSEWKRRIEAKAFLNNGRKS